MITQFPWVFQLMWPPFFKILNMASNNKKSFPPMRYMEVSTYIWKLEFCKFFSNKPGRLLDSTSIRWYLRWFPTCVPRNFLKNNSLLFRNLFFGGHYFLRTKTRSALWSKCAANFEKVPKCAAGAKRLESLPQSEACPADKLSVIVLSSAALEGPGIQRLRHPATPSVKTGSDNDVMSCINVYK